MSDHDHIDDDPALARVEQLLRSVGAPPEPSDELRQRLLQIPRDEARRGSVPAPARGWRRAWTSIAAWRSAAGALAVAAVVLAVVAVTSGGSSTPSVSGKAVALRSAPEYQVTGSAVSMVANGQRRIRVRIDGLPGLVGNEVYELWIARDKTHRVSLGVFKPRSSGQFDATVTVPDLGPQWHGVWLTREPGTGKPGWSHDWIVAGRLTAA
jgi:anti-sigma-K factor RskA